jgi:hypothetical protein
VAGDAAAEAQPVGVRRGEENAPSVTTMSTERSTSLQAPDPSQRTSKQAPQPPSGSAPKKGFPRLSAPVEKYGLQNVQWSGSGERSVGWLIGWLIGWLVGLGILFPVLGAPRVLGDRPVAAGALRGAKGGGARVHPVWRAAEEGCARRGGGGRRGGWAARRAGTGGCFTERAARAGSVRSCRGGRMVASMARRAGGRRRPRGARRSLVSPELQSEIAAGPLAAAAPEARRSAAAAAARALISAGAGAGAGRRAGGGQRRGDVVFGRYIWFCGARRACGGRASRVARNPFHLTPSVAHAG